MHRGKKRALADSLSDGSSSSTMRRTSSSTVASTKKPKRAETRQCPVCREQIPLRLLPVHSELESERVEDIMKQIGSTEVMADGFQEGSSPRDRRSAARARQSLSNIITRVGRENTSSLSSKTIQVVRRHRKQRYTRLRELARDEEDESNGNTGFVPLGDAPVCPVCSQQVTGDQDVVEAHIDACLAHESLRMIRANQEDAWEDVDVEGDSVIIGSSANLRAMGFHVRNRNHADVEDEVDVDGDDEAVFGDAQFTEGDILLPHNGPRHAEGGQGLHPGPEGESGDDDLQTERESLRDLVANGNLPNRSLTLATTIESKVNGDAVTTTDLAIASARTSGNLPMLVVALEKKIALMEQASTSNPSPLCRICIDPYSEPTVSTGCWHTCCKECWLRCLGSTKLCPICKRITAATELRRIYL